MNHFAASMHILRSFAYDGFRAFFRPKLSEKLVISRLGNRWLADPDIEELGRRPNAYFYVGLGVELVTATVLFVVLISASFAAQFLMDEVVRIYADPKKWGALIELFAAGTSSISLLLFAIFFLKAFYALLNRLNGE